MFSAAWRNYPISFHFLSLFSFSTHIGFKSFLSQMRTKVGPLQIRCVTCSKSQNTNEKDMGVCCNHGLVEQVHWYVEMFEAGSQRQEHISIWNGL